jgi:hypothetical protein
VTRPLRVLGAHLPMAGLILAMACLPLVPLTYDEAWNFTNVSSRGVAFAYRSYEFPNNHTLFSIVQTLIPHSAVDRWPPLLRVPNVLIAFALLITLHITTRQRRAISGALVAAALALCSPIFTSYLLIARGYLLGTVLLLAAVHIVSEDRHAWLGGFTSGLAVAVVPTFGYAVPGIAACLALRFWRTRDFRPLLLFAVSLVASVTAFYAPKFGTVLEQGRRWREDASIGEFIASTGEFVGNGALWSLAAVALAVALITAVFRRGPQTSQTRDASSMILLASSVVSFYACVGVLAAVDIANPPYPRNAVFAPLFVWVMVVMAARHLGGRWSVVGHGALGLNAAAGAWLLLVHFVAPSGNPTAYPLIARLGGTAIERAIRSDAFAHATSLECNWAAKPVAELYGRVLKMPVNDVRREPGECGVGDTAPPRDASVWAVDGEHRTLLCF